MIWRFVLKNDVICAAFPKYINLGKNAIAISAKINMILISKGFQRFVEKMERRKKLLFCINYKRICLSFL